MKDFSQYPAFNESIESEKKAGLVVIGVRESEFLLHVYMVKPSIPGLYTKIWYRKDIGSIFRDMIDTVDIVSLIEFDKALAMRVRK